jgi:hypothetical protein
LHGSRVTSYWIYAKISFPLFFSFPVWAVIKKNRSKGKHSRKRLLALTLPDDGRHNMPHCHQVERRGRRRQPPSRPRYARSPVVSKHSRASHIIYVAPRYSLCLRFFSWKR